MRGDDPRHEGRKVDWIVSFTAAAYNLVRWRTPPRDRRDHEVSGWLLRIISIDQYHERTRTSGANTAFFSTLLLGRPAMIRRITEGRGPLLPRMAH
jgi:hypothetical protein